MYRHGQNTIISAYCSDPIVRDRWGNDEEVVTITGRLTDGFDPICCNMYEIFKHRATPHLLVQRVFHGGYEDADGVCITTRLSGVDIPSVVRPMLIDHGEYLLDAER